MRIRQRLLRGEQHLAIAERVMPNENQACVLSAVRSEFQRG